MQLVDKTNVLFGHMFENIPKPLLCEQSRMIGSPIPRSVAVYNDNHAHPKIDEFRVLSAPN